MTDPTPQQGDALVERLEETSSSILGFAFRGEIIDNWIQISALLREAARALAAPAEKNNIVHCTNCGCSWIDDGINPIGCPYC